MLELQREVSPSKSHRLTSYHICQWVCHYIYTVVKSRRPLEAGGCNLLREEEPVYLPSRTANEKGGRERLQPDLLRALGLLLLAEGQVGSSDGGSGEEEDVSGTKAMLARDIRMCTVKMRSQMRQWENEHINIRIRIHMHELPLVTARRRYFLLHPSAVCPAFRGDGENRSRGVNG
nr:hypothetical protein CFP56_23786 [Quercus suber]